MDSKMFLFVMLMSSVIFSSNAHNFPVGGKQGWIVKPSEGYNEWSSRNRFQINDTLVFKYNKDTDSVLVLNNKQDYDSCNMTSPVQKMEGGESSFTFDKSGPFFFITGNQTNCQNGQKLYLVVLSPRIKSTPPSPVAPPPSSGGTPSPTGDSTPPPIGSTPTPGGPPGGNTPGGNTPGAQPPTSSSSPALKSTMGFAVGFSMLLITLVSAF